MSKNLISKELLRQKQYTASSKKIVIPFGDLNPELRKAIDPMRRFRRYLHLNEAGIALTSAFMAWLSMGVPIMRSLPKIGALGAITYPFGSMVKEREQLGKLIRKSHEEITDVISQNGILKKTGVKGRYGIDLKHANTVAITHPFFYVKGKNLVLITPTQAEKRRNWFQRKFGRAFFGRWRGTVKKPPKKTKKRKLKHATRRV